MIESIGWVAGLLFAFCGAPQALQCIRKGHSESISKLFLFMWLSGELLMQVYVILKHGFDMPLLVNYWINTIFCFVIGFYMLFPRKFNN